MTGKAPALLGRSRTAGTNEKRRSGLLRTLLFAASKPAAVRGAPDTADRAGRARANAGGPAGAFVRGAVRAAQAVVAARGYWLTPLLAGILLSRATVMDLSKPFGTAFVIGLAALGLRTRALVATAGAIVGDVVSPPIADGVRTWPVLLVVWCVTAAAGRWFRVPPAVIALGAVLGAASLRFVEAAFTGGDFAVPALASVSEMLAVALLFPAARLFARRPAELGRGQIASVLFVAGLLIIGTEDFRLYGYSVTDVLMRALLLVLAAAGVGPGSAGGMGIGAAAGTMLSLLSVLGTGLWSWTSAVLAPAGLLAGLGATFGRIGAVAGLFIAQLFLSPYAADGFEIATALTDSLLAAALAALVPRRVLDRLAAVFPETPQAQRAREERRLRAETAARRELRKIAASLEDAGRRLGAPRPADAGESVDRFVLDVSERVCAGCSNRTVCWETHVYNTYRDLLQTAAGFSGAGVVRPGDLPDGLRRRCVQPEYLADGVSRLLKSLPQAWHAAAGEASVTSAGRPARPESPRERAASEDDVFAVYAAVQRQFAGIAAVLGAVADRLEGREAGAYALGTVASGISTDETLYSPTREAFWAMRSAEAPARATQAPPGPPGAAARVSAGPKASAVAAANAEDASETTLKSAAQTAAGTPVGWAAGPTAAFGRAKRRKEHFRLAVDVGRVTASGSAVSGDSFRRIDLPGHRVVLSLSDGMGTGAKAAVESDASLAMLERFLLDGFDLAFAAQMINLVLLLRSPGETFATLDVCEFDLTDGSVRILKTGAPPTYIRRADHVDAVRADSLPVGILQAVDTSVVEYRLNPGDTVVMVTDGALETGAIAADKAEALARALRRLETREPRETVSELLKRVETAPEHVVLDDATVVAARLLAL